MESQEQVEPITVEPLDQIDPEPTEPGDVMEPEATEAKVSREQKYRRKLRETEAERDTLRTALTEARRLIINQNIDHQSAELFWRINHDLTPDDFFTTDNELDSSKVRDANAELCKLVRSVTQYRSLAGRTPSPEIRSARFADAFRPQEW